MTHPHPHSLPARATEKLPAIVFDFGGVIMDWNPRHLYRKFFDSESAMENFLNEIGFAEWNLQQDKGRPFAVAVTELARQFPHYADLIRAYDERWAESLAGPIAGTIDILRMLKDAGYLLYGLSNWSAEKFEITRTRYPFFTWFEWIMVSGQVKLIKPDPQIFHVFLQRLGRPAHECVFIDDSPANIDAARMFGFETIHFQSPPQLRQALKCLALL